MKALLPLSWLYGAGVAIERRVRMVPKRREAAGGPRVVSIGNLEAGGNGKTPLAIWWLSRAVAAGQRAAYVSRGYGSAADSSRRVTCVLPAGMAVSDVAGLRLLAPLRAGLARDIGDEGALVVERAPGVPALFGADKRRAVEVTAALGVDTVVLDDGFQSWRVERHVDVVLLDAGAPLDGGQLLPAGRLRERPQALRRADAVVFNGVSDESALRAAHARVARWLREGIPAAGLVRRVTLVAAGGGEAAHPRRLLAVSAIARPEGFARSLAAAGVEVVAHVTFRDHHRYDARDVTGIAARARGEGLDVVTTEKDWVKLRDLGVEARVWVARLDVSLIGDPLPV